MPNKPIPDGPFKVWYADPPWSYRDKPASGGAIGQYQTMTLKDICNLGEQIKRSAEKNSVLFLWVPGPILPDAFPVIKAWGFNYKANIVWDKQSHNMGRYFSSVRHEHLLLSTRGSCFPVKGSTKHSTVLGPKRSRYHSAKPERFRTIIDRMYPDGKRIELFARLPREKTIHETLDWRHWGNEV